MLADVLGDRLQEVRLAEPGAAVDEERVVRLRRRLGDRERGRVRETVRRADHERVERVLRVHARRPPAPAAGARSTGPLCSPSPLGDLELDPALVAGRVARRRPDQAEEVALDPLAREVVRNAEDERVVVQLETRRRRRTTSVSGLVERPPEPTGNLAPEACLQSARSGAPRAPARSFARGQEGRAYSVSARPQRGCEDCRAVKKTHDLQGIFSAPHDSPQLWTTCRGDA